MTEKNEEKTSRPVAVDMAGMGKGGEQVADMMRAVQMQMRVVRGIMEDMDPSEEARASYAEAVQTIEEQAGAMHEAMTEPYRTHRYDWMFETPVGADPRDADSDGTCPPLSYRGTECIADRMTIQYPNYEGLGIRFINLTDLLYPQLRERMTGLSEEKWKELQELASARLRQEDPKMVAASVWESWVSISEGNVPEGWHVEKPYECENCVEDDDEDDEFNLTFAEGLSAMVEGATCLCKGQKGRFYLKEGLVWRTAPGNPPMAVREWDSAETLARWKAIEEGER